MKPSSDSISLLCCPSSGAGLGFSAGVLENLAAGRACLMGPTPGCSNSEIISLQYPNGVQIEVTSPGIDAPLEHPFQYKKNINRKNFKMFNQFQPFYGKN